MNPPNSLPPEGAAPRSVDLILEPEWMLPIAPANVCLKDHALIIDGERIVDLLPADIAAMRYAARTRHRLPGQVLLPGLVNAHTHAAMTLLRGYADDLPLEEWLRARVWPAEARFVGPDFVRVGSRLACLEMLQGGITCFNDMYFHPAETAAAAIDLGIRASLGMVVIDFPTAYASDPDDYLRKGIAIRDRFRTEGLLSFMLAPHAPYTVGDSTFERIATLAAQLECGIHIHVHETAQEVHDGIKAYGERPLQRLDRLGILGPQTLAVHAVHLDGADRALLAERGCSLGHCPISNAKLASGMSATGAALKAGINLAIGTDGAASNNRLDLWQEMRFAAFLAKLGANDAACLDAHQVLRAATLGGAQALGLDHEIGTLQPGKLADVITVRLDEWHLQPVFDPASHLVYVCGREQVSGVWVAGRCRKFAGNLVDPGLAGLIEETKLWHTRIATAN